MAMKVTVSDNGPIRLEADPSELNVHDAKGIAFGLGGRAVISLCRCGLSANKPFCDGAHARHGFQSACEARELPPPKPKV